MLAQSSIDMISLQRKLISGRLWWREGGREGGTETERARERERERERERGREGGREGGSQDFGAKTDKKENSDRMFGTLSMIHFTCC